MNSPEKFGKKKRTLVIVDGDALREGRRYDFSFLEKEKRLEVWFFFRERINNSFRLRKDFSAHNIVTPRYEEDTHLYLLKRVCFELGRRRERYKKVLLIGGHHPIWESLVQFLRERDFTCTHILADDYSAETEAPAPTKPQEERGLTSQAFKQPPAPTPPTPVKPPQKKPPTPAEKNKTVAKPQPKVPPSPPPKSKAPAPKPSKPKPQEAKKRDIYAIVAGLLKKLPAGTPVERDALIKLLHEEGIIVRRDIPGQSLKVFLERMAKLGHIQLQEGKILVPA
ncbi:MAG: hypothetical protein RMJ66_05185 [Bacteroidia bacterium]|nr:hypothetical protein [Bacteroidia bacterium]